MADLWLVCLTVLLESLLAILDLVDLGVSGIPFTRSNNRQDLGIIQERLDRGLASHPWLHLFPEFSLLHIPAFSSDHNPIFLNSSDSSPSIPKPFKFEEFWTEDPTCSHVIDTTWKLVVSSNPGLHLVIKLKHTTTTLKR